MSSPTRSGLRNTPAISEPAARAPRITGSSTRLRTLRKSSAIPVIPSTTASPSSSTVLSGSENPLTPLLPVHDTNANSRVMCTTAPAMVFTPTAAVAAAGSIPTRCSNRTPSAMPPVPAGVMLDANDDATRDRSGGRERHRLRDRTDERHRREHVRERGAEEDERDPLPVGVLEGVPRVADVRELRQQEVERGGQRDDGEQRARPHPLQPFERHRGRAGLRLYVRTQVLERDLTGAEPSPHRAGQRQRLQQRQGGRDPSDAESVDRGVDRGVDADEQRGLDEQLRDVPRPLAGVAASSASSKSTRWGRSKRVDDHVLQREVAVRDAGVVEHTDLGPQLVEEGAVDARRIDLRHALTDDELGDDHRRAVRRRADADEARRARAAVRGAVEGERFVLDPALHGRIGRLDLVAAQADRPVEAREIVGAAIVRGPQLHEQHPVTRGLGAVRERLPVTTRLADHAQAGHNGTQRARERFGIGCAIRCAEHDERKRPDDDADRDREHDIERAGGGRQRPQEPEHHDGAPERALPLPAHPDARERHHRRARGEVRRAREARIVEPADPHTVQCDRARRLGEVEHPVRELHRPGRDDRAEHEHAEATPAALDHQHDRDDEDHADGDHLGDTDDGLLEAAGKPRHRVDQVGLRAADRVIRDGREPEAERDERAADEEAQHVAR